MTYAQYGRLMVHVAASNREVVCKAHKMLSRKGKSRAMRDQRHTWLRAILKHHADERELCRRWRF